MPKEIIFIYKKHKNINELFDIINDETINFYIQIEVIEALIYLDKIDETSLDNFIFKIKYKITSEKDKI